MIFSTNKAAEVIKNDVAFLEAGIHENVSLVNVRKEKSQNGNTFIEFEFNKNGSKLTHTEWEPTKFGNQTDDEFNEKVNKQVARILQIMSVFFNKEQLVFEADSFDVFSNWVISVMNAADKTKLVRIKAVYGKSGYVSLPQYAKYTFIESMDIASDKSKIKELAIDKFDRPEIGDKEIQSPSAATIFATPNNVSAFTSGASNSPF